LDHIVATFPSEYIFDARTISETHRVLKPGGTLLIVPFAWITGGDFIHKAVAWLFNVTGESPKPDKAPLQPLINAGFLATSEKIEIDSSRVLLIRAQKPPN